MNIMRENYLSSDTSTASKIGQSMMIFPGSTQPIQALRAAKTSTLQTVSTSTQPRRAFEASHRANLIEASTKRYEISDVLYSKIENIFWAAKGENFEDGMESSFSHQLISFVKKYGNDALEAITCLIVYERVNSEVIGEALRCLGRIEHTESYEYRRWLLERSLGLSSTRVRDGAIIGISFLDDKHAIPYLKSAIQKEKCSELKADMETVLEQLES
jgi:hypothetical protein